MISINIGSPPDGDINRKMEWVIQALFTIQNTLKSSDHSIVTDGFEQTGTLTETRTLNASTATLGDVTNVLGTLLKDFRVRGSKGV